MNENIAVSIIIPIYNVEQYLRQCLDSVVNQTFKNFECICINDCSTDNSYTILKEYEKKDNRFIIINLPENKGQGVARNSGLKYAKGKYITFIDSDDWVSNDYIEILYSAIEKYNTDFVSAKFYLFDNVKQKIKRNSLEPKIPFNTILCTKKDKKKIIKNISFLQTSTVCGNIFKRKFLLSNNMSFKPVKFEDTLFIWEAIIRANNFIFIEDIIYFYRKNRKNSTMVSFTAKDRMKYYIQLIELNQRECNKDYLPYCYTYILLRSAVMSGYLPLEKAKQLFSIVGDFFKDNKYIIDYNYATYIDKIRLFIFLICLKYNLKIFFIYLSKVFNKIKRVLRFNKY